MTPIPGLLIDLGVMEYRACTEFQKGTLEAVAKQTQPDTLILVEHPPVLTLGANFHRENLLHSEQTYREKGIQIEPTERGGDITYHGPGQLVAYPIFDIQRHGKDLHKWLRDLEEAIILTCASFRVTAERFPPHTGVWTAGKKICAIGIKVRRWVSMHGIALNCNTDLSPFELIVPCGIEGYGVTSLSREAGKNITVEEAKAALIRSFEQVFGETFKDQR